MMRRSFKKKNVLFSSLLICALLAPNFSVSASTYSNNTNVTVPTKIAASLSDITSNPDNKEAVKTFQQIADEKTKSFRNLLQLSSISSAINENGKVVYQGKSGYKDLKEKTPLTSDTMYGIGSVSKVFTTAAIMQLVEQGKVDLEKPVTTYIPKFKLADPRYKDITVRMLLNHSSGLMGSTFRNTLLLNDSSTYYYDHLLENLSRQHLKYAPGSCSVYCNDGFSLAEMIVANVTKMSFTDYISKYISQPLGLKHTATPLSSFNHTKLARTYTTSFVKLPYEMTNSIGAGGIMCSAADLAKFGSGFSKDSTAILSEESKKATGNEEFKKGLWDDVENTMIAYGLGWDSVRIPEFAEYGITAYQKGGDVFGYHATLTVIPEYNLSMAALSSGGSSSALLIYTNTVLLNYLQDKGIITPKAPVTPTKPEKAPLPSNAINYIGEYAYTTASFEVAIKGDTIVINDDEALNGYYYTKDGYYYNENTMSKLQFVNKKGSTYIELTELGIIPGFGSITLTEFAAVKLKDNNVSDEILNKWKQREGKTYLPFNEKYTSAVYPTYTLPQVSIKVALNKGVRGYMNGNQIFDANHCHSTLEIPLMNGRDGLDLTFYTKNKKHYVHSNGTDYICTDDVKALPSKSKFNITTPKDDLNVFYKISKKSAGKTATIKVPKNASFIVYNEKGEAIQNYYIDHKQTAKLPKGGLLLFLSSKSSTFHIQVK